MICDKNNNVFTFFDLLILTLGKGPKITSQKKKKKKEKEERKRRKSKKIFIGKYWEMSNDRVK